MKGIHRSRNGKCIAWFTKFRYFPKVFTMCVIFVFCQDLPGIQIMSVTYITLYEMIFVGQFKSLLTAKQNFSELKQYVFIMLFNYHLFCFTDFVPDPQVRYNGGISAISLVTIEIFWVTIAWTKDTVIKMIWKFKKNCIYEPKKRRLIAERARKAFLKEGRVEAEEHLRYNEVDPPNLIVDDIF